MSDTTHPSTSTPPPSNERIVLIPLRSMVLMPGGVTPLAVGREKSTRALEAALASSRPVGFLLQRDAKVEDPAPGDLHGVGTIGRIVRANPAPSGGHHVAVQGEERFRVLEFTSTEPYLIARIERLPEREPGTDAERTEVEARAANLRQDAARAIALMPDVPDGLEVILRGTTDPSALGDLIAGLLDLSPEDRQELLETLDLRQRLARIGEKLGQVIDRLEVSQKIRETASGQMEDAQREYYLREQLRAIRKELGEEDSDEGGELADAIRAAGMPEEVEKAARKELRRLEGLPSASPETGVIRSYLEWLCELPWSKASEDRIDLSRAREVLDEDHHGLERIKKRILEFLAVRKLNPTGRTPILCFAGPPGVGKTSLGRSIARALDREFVRMSLGGVHDEAEIRGHRRTYVGALPGAVIQGIRRAGTRNPVFVLDEIDKLGRSLQGDPSSALLEVLDPEQNESFRDHYLGVPFDLSEVMFIATANVLDAIPAPLRDRCEVIELHGYTIEEKVEIGRRHLLPRQLERHGVGEDRMELTDAALRVVIEQYTREAGCRNLERELAGLVRHVAVRIAEGETERVVIDAEDVRPILGPRRFEREVATERTRVPGVATGLAWTPVGGEILFVEASRSAGDGRLILTGQLGDVMRESAQAALSLIKAQAATLGIDPKAFRENEVHVHVPAGSIPKDGPSAGVTLFAALVSLFTERPVRGDVAMTGEISLRGLVLPVGGIKDKVLAAHRAGVKKILLPKRNLDDLEEVPEATRADLEIVPIETVDELLDHAFPDATRPPLASAG